MQCWKVTARVKTSVSSQIWGSVCCTGSCPHHYSTPPFSSHHHYSTQPWSSPSLFCPSLFCCHRTLSTPMSVSNPISVKGCVCVWCSEVSGVCVHAQVYMWVGAFVYGLLCMIEKGLTSHILMRSDSSSLRWCGRPSRAAVLLSFVSYKTKISNVEILLQTSDAEFYNSQLVYSRLSSDSSKWLSVQASLPTWSQLRTLPAVLVPGHQVRRGTTREGLCLGLF